MAVYLAVGLGIVAVAALIFAVVAATGAARPNGQPQEAMPPASPGQRISEIRASTGRTSSGPARGTYWTPLPGGGFATESWDDRVGSTAQLQGGPASVQPVVINNYNGVGPSLAPEAVRPSSDGQTRFAGETAGMGHREVTPSRPSRESRDRERGEPEPRREEPRREERRERERAPREEAPRRPAERPEPRPTNLEPDVAIDEATGRVTISFSHAGVGFRVYRPNGEVGDEGQLPAGDRELVYERGDLAPGPWRVLWFDQRGIASRFKPFGVPAPPQGG